ncbi:MAG: DDE-type integrase/transposase/recombinase [Chloroflexi bacterium]|nr:DDE-type integrase/transposase/recombinase [Chloroflexota bacterium]
MVIPPTSGPGSQITPIGPRIACKFCDSTLTVRYGLTSTRRQRYLCHGCRRTFVDNGAPPGMRFPIHVIATALNQFYEAASLHWIRRHLMLQHGVQPDHANIRRWILRYTRQAVMALAGMRPAAGKIWAADETRLTTRAAGSQVVWLWDIMDVQSRFLLATGFSAKRAALDFDALLDLAARRASAWPEEVFADVLIPQIEATQGRMPQPLREGAVPPAFEVRPSTNAARRTLAVLRDRNPILQRLGNRNTAHLVVSGWAVHYNFFRPHPGLGGRTPAEAAQVNSPLKNWADVVTM